MPESTLEPLARPRVVRGRSPSDLYVSDWSVGQVRAALRQHLEGDFSRSALLADACRGDDRVQADLRTRVFAVTGLPFRVDPSPAGDQRRAKAVAAELAECWSEFFPASTVRAVLRWGVLLGVCVARCEWFARGGRWRPSLAVWHPQHLRWSASGRRYEVQSDQGILEVSAGDGAWLLHLPDGECGWLDASLRGLALPYLLRTHARRDWARFSEKHGLPITGAVVPAEADAGDKEAFFADLRSLGSEGIVLLPRDREGKGFSLELLEPKNYTAWQGFEHALRHCDASIAVVLLGQASNAQDGGSYAKAVALGTIRQDLLEADAASLAETIRSQVLRPWAAFNYGDPELAPVPVWDATPPEDAVSVASTLATAGGALVSWQTAAREHGFEVDFEALAQRFGVPLRRPHAEDRV